MKAPRNSIRGAFCGNDAFNFPSHRPLVGAQPLEVRPHDEDDSSGSQCQQQHKAEIVFCSVHLSETSGATARARCARSSLCIMSLSTELILKCWAPATATLPLGGSTD